MQDSAGSIAERAIVQLDRQDYAGAITTLEAALNADRRALDPSALDGDAERLAEKLMNAAQSLYDSQPELAQRLAGLYYRIAPEEAAMAAPAPAEEEDQGGGGQAAPSPGEWGDIAPGAGTGGAADRREPLYVVRSGDTLSGIAARLWGNAQAWPQLLERHNTFSQADARDCAPSRTRTTFSSANRLHPLGQPRWLVLPRSAWRYAVGHLGTHVQRRQPLASHRGRQHRHRDGSRSDPSRHGTARACGTRLTVVNGPRRLTAYLGNEAPTPFGTASAAP
jgi:hypothetical protein